MAVHAPSIPLNRENPVMHRELRATFLLLLIIPACATAQETPDSVHHRNDCRLAAQVLSMGHPAPGYSWALDVAWRCPEAAPALATEMMRSAAVHDTSFLNRLTQPTIELRDGRIMQVALAIAADRSASSEARIFAIRTLIYSMRPGGGIDYDDLATHDYCYGYGPSLHQIITNGVPLPQNYVQQINILGLRLAADEHEPAVIRHAGACAGMAREQIH